MKTKKDAVAAGRKLQKRFSLIGSKIEVWENQGWHYSIKYPRVQLFESEPGSAGTRTLWIALRSGVHSDVAISSLMHLLK